MMENHLCRTDLARESDAVSRAETIAGLEKESRCEDGVELFEVRVNSDEAACALGKSRGRYLTVGVGRVWEDDAARFRLKTELLSRRIRSFLPRQNGCVLLVGLGNRHITADAVGPMSLERVLVTRHLEEKQKTLFDSLSLSRTAAITPGVLGETGMESADIIRSLVSDLRPSAVLCVDALASRSLARLATTVQITDAGISPGSGVGNRRDTLSRETLGVPVIALGVPTVVDAMTLAFDVLESVAGRGADFERLREEICPDGLNFFVTPKETDEILREISNLIGYAINLALHPSLDYEEMLSLAG